MINSVIGTTLTTASFLVCTLTSILLGLAVALGSTYKNKTSKSMLLTIAIMPMIIQVVMMIVNGNIGTGIAVAGAFTLVRFRTIPGRARDILFAFVSMSVGMATGVGYIFVAVTVGALGVLLTCLYTKLGLGNASEKSRQLRITIPESLNFSHVFDEVFEKYTKIHIFLGSKTTNMGSLFRLTYDIELIDLETEKEFLDELRCLNGNLEISCNIVAAEVGVL